MSQQHSENFEANLGSGRNNFANVDGGAMLIGASLSDMNSMRLSGSTKLHDVQIAGLGSGLLDGSNDKTVLNDQVPLVDFDRISSDNDKPTAFDRWPFMGGRNQESLHDKIGDKLKEGMKPEDRTNLEKEEEAYNKAFKRWSMQAGIALQPPDLKDYPALEQHLNRVKEVEKGVVKTVMNGLTPEEKDQLKREDNPLGPGLRPRPMHEEVVKRIREQTLKYLNGTTQVSQREHNRT